MHLHFERVSSTRTDCNVLSLTWMGKVPDELPDDDGWKLNRLSYYQDGWLATGNARGIVGVTFTTSSFCKISDLPLRTNYNLRGHRSEVTLVKWNEPYQKLASCDSSGIIFVWIKYEGRWSIELINDRSTKVTDFSWSHDGRMALICYQDGFVLVGSVAGQRYWSSMLNLESTITCGIWAPDDQQVLFGTSNGQILVIDVHGTVIAQISIQDKVVISSMSWSCEKFKMEETDEDDNSESVRQQQQPKSECQSSALAICFQNGTIYLMKSYDDISPVVITTGLKGVKMEWSNNGDVLAVAGFSQEPGSEEFNNYIQFYTDCGGLRFSSLLPCTQYAVTALTWGHNDKRLFIATGCTIHIGWVTRRVASLQLLSRLAIHNCLQDESCVHKLPLPRRLRTLITNMFGQTIKCYLPEPKRLREFVSKPPINNIRLHCTMIRHDDDIVTGNATYTLFLEYLGGLLPLLKGKRASKIRPEFVIFDPEAQSIGQKFGSVAAQAASPPSSNHSSARVSPHPLPSSSDSEVEEGCASPRLQRRRRHRRQNAVQDLETLSGSQKELVYLDDLPESYKLVAVTSNIWGTKFKLLGLAPWLPALLGTISYRTSLLHLQPRQMTLVMKELNGPEPADPNRLLNLASSSLTFSEDEDDVQEVEGKVWEESAPIAPMTPKKQQKISGSVHFPHQHYFNGEPQDSKLESPTEDYVKLFPPDVHVATLQCTPIEVQNGVSPPVTFQANTHPFPILLQNKINSVTTSGTASQRTMSSCRKTSVGASSTSTVINGVTTKESSACCLQSESPKEACLARDGRNGFVCNGFGCCSDDRYDGLENLHHLSPDSSSKWQVGSEHCSEMEEIPPTSSHAVFASRSHTTPRWAEKVGDLKFIDEDLEEVTGDLHIVGCPQSSSTSSLFLLGHRSRSVGYLHTTEFVGPRDFRMTGSFKDHQRRLTFKSRLKCEIESQSCEKREEVQSSQSKSNQQNNVSKKCVTSAIESLQGSTPRCDNGVKLCNVEQCMCQKISDTCSSSKSFKKCPKKNKIDGGALFGSSSLDDRSFVSCKLTVSKDDNVKDVTADFLAVPRMKEHRASLPQTDELIVDKSSLFGGGSKSIPSSPVSKRRDSNPRKGLLYSPRLLRRSRRQKMIDSSDEDVSLSGEDTGSEDFKDLESFQKAYIRKKLKKWRGGTVADGQDGSPASSNYREFVLHNKAPLWNEMSQVYQLDFGGRVTQESAKNFQVEFRSKQVMQFGRIDGNAYTLDFQYPFCALQAFAVALANVTQRLK